MKKVLLAAATVLVALFATLGVAPAASAYPELTCNLTVDSQVVNEGDTFTATGTAAVVEKNARGAAVGDDIHWVMTFNGETRTGAGAVFTQTFTAPNVTKKTVFPLTAKTSSDAGTCQRTVDITVLPGGAVVEPPGEGPGEGGLPNTGGPRLILLIAGILLLLGGSGAVVVARRRASA
ncbi:MAG: LPXTG cell wall anchor domain-containing protein [Nocardioidaceae bacterium]|nr:LPXTG cell wall anchor domain-containing protein [Nocardioidaceae bacterium]